MVPMARVGEDAPHPSGVAWNPATGWIDASALEGADVVVHLAGESLVSLRWTRAKKERILQSRVRGTQQVARAISSLETPPRLFLCASGVGYYPPSLTRTHREGDAPGEGFLSRTAVGWEEAARLAGNVPAVSLRFGVVLDPAGGALGSMLLPFRCGLGGRMGSGRQWFPWVAAPEVPLVVDHLIRLSPPPSGPVNVVAPHPVTNREFTRALAASLGRPAFLPAPAWAIRLALGEAGEQMLLASWRAEPSFLERSGYRFRYPDLPSCLDELLSGKDRRGR